LLDVYARPVSFEPRTKNSSERLFKAYAAEVARVDQTARVISAIDGDVDTASDGFPDNTRLFLLRRLQPLRGDPRDQLTPVAPWFAPSRGAGAAGSLVPAVPGDLPVGRDAADR